VATLEARRVPAQAQGTGPAPPAPRRATPSRSTPAPPGHELFTRLAARMPMQAALRASRTDDAQELEAERMADDVRRGDSDCGCGGSCGDCGDEEPSPARAAALSGAPVFDEADSAERDVRQVMATPASPLDARTRSFFEHRWGAQLGGVRVHTGPDAARSASALGAHAYTVGEDIVFGDADYRPGSEHGRRLLAHELTHVLQQRAAGPALQRNEKDEGIDVAIVLDGAEESALAAKALAGRTIRVYDETDLRDKLKAVGVKIRTLYVISHSNAAGDLQFESQIGTIKWMKAGDIARKLRVSSPPTRHRRWSTSGVQAARGEGGAGQVHDGRGRQVGSRHELLDLRRRLRPRDPRRRAHQDAERRHRPGALRQGLPPAPQQHEGGERKIREELHARAGEGGDRRQVVAKLKEQYFRGNGSLVAEWVSPEYNKKWQAGSLCIKDVTATTKPCKLITVAAAEPLAEPDTRLSEAVPSVESEPVEVASDEAVDEAAVDDAGEAGGAGEETAATA
jgi:hypothetical protein